MSATLSSKRRRTARALLRGWLFWWALERLVRWWLIRRFFRREASRDAPFSVTSQDAVTLVQPILSGDPHLGDTLRANATLPTALNIRWKWLVDADDLPGRKLTDDLLAELALTVPEARRRVERVLTPPAPPRVNPKTYKLRLAWERRTADGSAGFFGVLDDDTRLLPGQLETAVATLQREERAGLVFGLPYYRSFGTPWAALVSAFVNRNSLWSYLPILSFMPPPTINGMFWLARPEAIEALDGFRAVEGFVCDDYAVARGVRAAGYTLRQLPIVNPLETGVADARAYDRLLTRWFIFPQVSLLRHEPTRRLAGFYVLVFLPAFQFFTALVLAALAGGWRAFATVGVTQGWRELLQAQLERAHLPGAAGDGREFWRRRALGWAVDLCLPLQVVRALLSPRVIEWRGHRLRLDPDGRFEYLHRRGDP